MTDRAKNKLLFRKETERYNFKCECQDCVFYEAQKTRCSHGYPTLAERRLTEASPLVDIFCKEFSVM